MKRRTFLALTSLLVLALALVACGPAAEPATTLAPATQPEENVESPTEGVADATEAPPEAADTFNVAVTDGLGREVTLNAKPQRIISLTLGTDEILLDLVGPDRLIGVTYLASDETTSNIASNPLLAEVENTLPSPDPEQIIALEPDLVFVASFTDAAVLNQLDGAGVTYFVVGFFTSIDAMQENVLTIGELVGEPEIAMGIVAEMDATLTRIYDTVYSIETERPSVLYLASDGWVAGANTTTDDIITRAGGINAAADLVDWNQISAEAIIEMNPDAVILSPYVADEEFLLNPAYASLNAVANGKVYTISDAYMSAVSQYIVLGVVELAEALYPDLFPDA